HGEESLRFQRERVAVLIVGADLYALGTRHELVDTGQRKTALLDIGFAGAFEDLRIHQNDQRIVTLGDVDHDDALVHVNLSRGQADSGRRVHGFDHVGDQLFQRFIKYSYRRGNLVEPGVGVAEDVQNRHRRT